MSLSRKRKKELKRLKRSAEELWDEQRAAIDHASDVLRDASRQAGHYAREQVGPRVRDTYEDRVKPVVSSSVTAGRSVASAARDRFDDVLPAIAGAIGTALAALEGSKSEHVRDAVKQVSKAGQRVGLVTPPKKGAGPGTYVLVGLAIAAVAGIAYAAWQTLRADDDLWIEELGDGSLEDADIETKTV